MLSSLLVLAAEEDPSAINPVVPDNMGELFWGAIAFFVLWILMRYWLLPPLMKAREQRRTKEIEDLEAAEAAKSAAEQVRRDYDTTIAQARTRAAEVIEQARSAAEAERSEAIAAAEAEVAAQRQRAMAELDSARESAISQMGGDVVDLAVTAASKVVDSDLALESHRGTVETYLEANR